MSLSDIQQIDGFSNIWGCDAFFNELNNLYRKDRSTERQYQKWLKKRFLQLDNLDTWTISELLMQDAYEKIDDTRDGYCIYSLRRPEFTGNPRILFTIIESDQNQPCIMLLAFKELHDDYNRYIPTAKKRLEKIVRIIQNGGIER